MLKYLICLLSIVGYYFKKIERIEKLKKRER